ncbi:hypothetical protein H0W91_01070 [Patescibacteria group bacterium]|nr:hypothetical protein [Patescibacteria group bacterium]
MITYKKAGLAISSFALAALVFAGGGIALAKNNENEGGNKSEKMENALKMKQNAEIHVNKDGKINISGAKVMSVASTSLVARISFGSLNMDWTVQTDSSTKFSRNNGSFVALTDIRVGDMISFSGNIDSTLSTPTVNAKNLRDLSLIAVNTKHLFEGTLVSLAGSTTPTTAVVKVDETNYTVSIPSGISIIGNNWLAVSLSNFQIGNNLRVYGFIPASSTSISATIIRNTSL